LSPILAGEDEVNVESLCVLDKLGFSRVATHEGTFDNLF
jgi:hypothetical protein